MSEHLANSLEDIDQEAAELRLTVPKPIHSGRPLLESKRRKLMLYHRPNNPQPELPIDQGRRMWEARDPDPDGYDDDWDDDLDDDEDDDEDDDWDD